jgi:hypothetical protein
MSSKIVLTVSLFWIEVAEIDCANKKPADTRGRSFMMVEYPVVGMLEESSSRSFLP